MNRRFLLFVLFIFSASTFAPAQPVDSIQARNVSVRPARSSAEWVRRGVIYEVYLRSFSPEGNFAGLEKRLPELSRLGVTILWLMPIHPVGVVHRKGALGSPYSVKDYYAVNPEFGTMEDFKRLVGRAHALGFHLIIDLVANHTAWDSRLIKERPQWFTKDAAGNIVPPNPDWSDVADLDYSKPGLRHYMIEMMKYWVRDVGIDGFRCDVAEMVPTDFWESARTALDSIRPVMMLSEGSYPEHHLKAFDVTYSWNIYHSLAPIFAREKTARVLDIELNGEEATFPKGSLRMRFSSNHDENAWDGPDVDKFGSAGAKLAAVLVNTLPGIPLLYNGQEVGNRKKLGLFEKTSIDWTGGEEFTTLYSKLFELRKYQRAFSAGEMVRIPTTNDKRVTAFARVADSNRFIVVCNFDTSAFAGSLDLSSPVLSLEKQIVMTDIFTKRTTILGIQLSKLVAIEVPAMGFRIFQIEQLPH